MVIKSNEAMGLSHESKSPWRQALPQIIAVSVKNILLMAFGMSLGFPTILIPGLTRKDEPFNIKAEGLTWIGSIHLICVPIGSIVSGAVSEAVGRKRAMQLVNLPFVIAWLTFRFANVEWQVFAALALTGLAGGFLEAPVLTYVAEITQPRLRGVLSTTSSMAVIGGVLIMFLLGTFFAWRTVALLSCIFNVLSFTFLFFVPESPHWLISHNRLLDARKALAWLRGWTDLEHIEAEYKQVYRDVKMYDGAMNAHDNPVFEGAINSNGSVQVDVIPQPQPVWTKKKTTILDTLKLFTQRSFLWPFSLVASIFFVTHVTGMTTLQTYAVPIFQSMHAPIDKYYATVMLGCVEFLGCVFSTALVHYIGKRMLNFISILGSGVGFAAVGIYAQTNGLSRLIIEDRSGNATTDDLALMANGNEYGWVPLLVIIVIAFMAYLGLRVLPWILVGEVFSTETRAAAAGLCSAFTYIVSFAVNKEFLAIVDLLTLPGTFFMHAIMSVMGFFILYVFLPETEGKTLGQINEHFAGGARMGNHVVRTAKTKKESPRIPPNGIIRVEATNGHSESKF